MTIDNNDTSISDGGDNNITDDNNSNSLLNTSAVDAPIVETPTQEAPIGYSMEDFIGTMDEDIQGNKSWEKFKSPQDMAKSYIELQKLVGVKGDIPNSDATDEDWNSFYGKLGKPETFKDYEITLPDNLKSQDGAFEKTQAVMELAHSANLTTNQANKLFEGLFELESKELTDSQDLYNRTNEASLNELKESWGNGFDEMAGEVTSLEKRLGVFDDFETNGMNSNPAFLKLMGTIANELKETSTIESAIASTPVGVETELSEVTSRIKDFMTRGESIPQHLNDRRMELFNKMG